MTSTIHTSWQLAKLADCADPDEHDGRGFSSDQEVEPRDGSAGAQFLRSIEDSVNDRDEPDEDTAHEIADGAVPIYTHQKWQTFVDLAAYNEDPSELGYGDSREGMDKLADVCLYIIGARLAAALIEAQNEDDDDE